MEWTTTYINSVISAKSQDRDVPKDKVEVASTENTTDLIMCPLFFYNILRKHLQLTNN